MHIRLLPYLKSLLQAVVIFCVLSLLSDWYRKPAQPASSFSQPLPTLSAQAVSPDKLSENRIAVIYFWGSWCTICKYTSPSVDTLHRAGIPILGIALKSGSNQEVSAYMQDHGLHFPTVNDSDGLITEQWHVSVTPTFVFLKNGKMIHSTTGIGSYWGIRGRILLLNLLN